MGKFIILSIGIIGAFAFSISYNNHLLKKTVEEDVNSENFVNQYAMNENATNENSNSNNLLNQENSTGTNENDKDNSQIDETDGNSVNGETNDIKLEAMSESYNNLSNEKCAWGFVRKPNGQQPEFYGPHAKVLDNNQGIYCGNNDEKVLYLTFDEGYENGYSASILDTLKEKDVTAAFFVTMPYVKQNPELVKRMIAEGHIVGNHTVNHPSMPEVTNNEKLVNEVMELHNYIKDNFNYEMHYLRPPKGEYSERTVKICLDLGYRNVLWSSAYADWDPNNQKGNDNAKKMICNNFHNGNVMLLHAVSKDNANVLRRYY